MLIALRKNLGNCFPQAPSGPSRSTPPAAAARLPRQRLLVLLLGASVSLPAMADLSDTIHPFIQTSISYDDNLLRRDNDTPDPEGRSDTSKLVQGGLILERPIGRQVLTAQAKVSRVSFERHTDLDYSGKDFQAALQWQIANHLSGHAGAKYSQTLAPYTDFHTEERNLRTQRSEYVDGNWLFHPRWQTHLSFKREKYDYELTSQSYNNRTEDVSEFGVDYLAPTKSRVGFQLRHLKGTYPQRNPLGLAAIDDGYTQDEVKANVLWVLSGITQVQFLGGWVRREHPVNTFRDDSGTNGRVVADWAPLGKVQFRASMWREYASTEGTFVNSSLNTGASLLTTWDIADKISANAQLRSEKRKFTPLEGQVIADRGDLEDQSRRATVGTTYQLTRAIAFELDLYHESRTGSPLVGTNSFKANGVSISASGQF